MYGTQEGWSFPTLDINMAARPSDIVLPWIKWGENRSQIKYPGRSAHFYAWDFIFRALQKHPEKLISSQFSVAIEPNFSTWDRQPSIEALWTIYRKRKIAKWWQSKGCKLIVDLNVSDWLLKSGIGLWGVPKGWPCYATRFHGDSTIDEIEAKYGFAEKHSDSKPEMFWVFGGGPAVKSHCQARGWLWSKARCSWRNRDELFETKKLEKISSELSCDWAELPWSPQ
jgi:hypothetical protein